eukprot:11884209-Ditylum_brightwellii.AAC.1
MTSANPSSSSIPSHLDHMLNTEKPTMEESNEQNFIPRQSYTPLHFHTSLMLKMNDSIRWRKTV